MPSQDDVYEPGKPVMPDPNDPLLGASRFRAALEYMADPQSWGGDPHQHDAVLYGHETPYELARRALRLDP